MVGTYYSSSSPEAPSFVAVGSTVRSDTTVCIIEAMKVFTDIPAGAIPAGLGTITEILVKNGQSVEYGQPLVPDQARLIGADRDTRSIRSTCSPLSLFAHAISFGGWVDVSTDLGGQPRRDRAPDHPGVQGAGDRGGRRLLAGRPRRSVPGTGRPGDLHRQGVSSDSYLNINRLIAAAEVADVQAIHPGYGFLSENPSFAEICRSCNFEFIGPPHEAIRRMGLKTEAKSVANAAKVPCVPGSDGPIGDEAEAIRIAKAIGFPS